MKSRLTFTYEQTFGDLDQASFSAQEAADYLEVSLPTLRRYVQGGRLANTNSPMLSNLVFCGR